MSNDKYPNAPKDNPFMPDTSVPAEPIYRPFPERPPAPPVTDPKEDK